MVSVTLDTWTEDLDDGQVIRDVRIRNPVKYALADAKGRVDGSNNKHAPTSPSGLAARALAMPLNRL